MSKAVNDLWDGIFASLYNDGLGMLLDLSFKRFHSSKASELSKETRSFLLVVVEVVQYAARYDCESVGLCWQASVGESGEPQLSTRGAQCTTSSFQKEPGPLHCLIPSLQNHLEGIIGSHKNHTVPKQKEQVE